MLLIREQYRFVTDRDGCSGDRMALARQVQVVRIVLTGRRELVIGRAADPVTATLGCVPNCQGLVPA